MMRVMVFLVLLLLTVMIMVGNGEQNGPALLSRDDFPSNFIFGSGTSAYQVEGAAAEDGRSPSVWDTFAHAGYMQGTGDTASDEYHKYKEDVKLMKETGLDAYRFSISWSRLIPDGRGRVNPKALEYYNNLVNELLNHGIKPHVTLFHYDLPQVLEDEYEGWLSPKIVDDFTAYADVCFREFGDRVSHWTTLNEPNVLALLGYDLGFAPPKRCSHPFGNCSRGNSPTEPYIVMHHCLLAHSSAVSLYARKYKAKQQGFIGINVFVYHLIPLTNSTNDIIATRRAQDFYVGWLIEPLYRGDYPKTMRKMVGSKLPKFSRSQSEQLTGSYDFISLNYYAAMYVKDDPHDIPASQRDFRADMFAVVTAADNGLTKSDTLFPVLPSGLRGVLEYFKQSYGNPPIYIHENGFAMPQNGSLYDVRRVKYISDHLENLLIALRNGSNTLGYFTWSFIDAYELLYGYEYSYGLYYVDFGDEDRKRYPRFSARWYSSFLRGRNHTNLMNSSPNLTPFVSTT
ncbi:cyanidin 3-O-glucoside 7-O-glucosyltransferase (acyl-glucose)-like isoform X1 [Ananas comosus]|uniref:Cyanidin 3-O-glucoside 7-O-glucosyltransferase (Acyl-glucose)-like isoform X1 n=1 Tax=Ananas comosus TaxID=4615 RepID=A0A6P5G636_ANACO|nr:cyanidin 3-O-glucoside 7-O-glucosyltransferase (acyl-glucose)-like isoform X1 [Ananas comosus]